MPSVHPGGLAYQHCLRSFDSNREGGIPSHARGGNPHLSINLASEYSYIGNSFIWSRSHPTALSNLSMVRDCLFYMPHTSSGVVVSHRSPKSLIANLITNKAAHSPSLPHRLLANRKDVRHTPTIVRPGLPVRVIQDFSQVDRSKLADLLEASFRRELAAEKYYARLAEKLDFVIVTGDYQGAAIVTREFAPEDDKESAEPIAYLDKFAVLPTLQGSGTVDFLWGALRDEVHGLGLLDALNDNGGKGGYGLGRDLVWKSRADNPVNRWYFERSNGFVRIETQPKPITVQVGADDEGDYEMHRPAWTMFWCDAEDKLARMAGERRLSAEATPEDVLDLSDAQSAALLSNSNHGSPFFPLSSSSSSFHAAGAGGNAYMRNERDEQSHAYYPSPSGSGWSSSSNYGTGAYACSSFSSPSFSPSSPSADDRYRGSGGGERVGLLPIVAPAEEGRLQRWASCMNTIPSAWK